MKHDRYPTIDRIIGNTPVIRLQRQETGTSTLLVKLEGSNPAGSVKDRPARNMIEQAEKRGRIRPGDTLIEATSGNTGIALAMVAAIKGYPMTLLMPEGASKERQTSMRAYGAKLILTPKDAGMEGARDQAEEMEKKGEGIILNQFGNIDNPLSHYESTGPEIWRDTDGEITHFVASLGTTGTVMGTGRYLKEKSSAVQIVGVEPGEGARIPGIRKWPEDYRPTFYEPERIDRFISVSQLQAEETSRNMAEEEGLFCGISSGGNIFAALQVARQAENALVVAIVCDRGDRYLSTGVFDKE